MELKLHGGAGPEIHVYEAYWSPLTEGVVTLRDVMNLLIGAGINGVKWAQGAFQHRTFGKVRQTHLPVRHLIYVTLALLAILALIVINAAVVAAPLAFGLLKSPPGWLSALLGDLTSLFNAA